MKCFYPLCDQSPDGARLAIYNIKFARRALAPDEVNKG